jgi:hypothetical protein
VFSTRAHTLAQDISGDQYSRYGLTPRTRFDRIDLGRTLADAGHMRDVLKSWTPLLALGDTAAIVGVFSDWTGTQKDGSVAGADDTVVAPIVEKLIKLGRVTTFPRSFSSRDVTFTRVITRQVPPGTTLADAMATETAQLDAAYDNSKAFSRFLKSSTLGAAFREMTLKRRLRHKILPQVRRVPP